ncbi:MAG TPA: fibrillarin-like rRNA/tRNA 2'-O-methyltransferase [Thermoplasmata archaeon]|nr:fibrillarin-like rRNA/tRNA 2'-O-methyltransferase [Thermoplasmata archaeon]
MRPPTRLVADPDRPSLFRSREDERPAFWTVALGSPPEVYGERVTFREDQAFRRWDPMRSKLGAALAKGYAGPLPASGEYWLYLGAASGTTASHVADLVGRSGAVFALEKSLRPFARLLRLADRYPNLLPVLGDARAPQTYLALVPPVDGLYVDVAQPDQLPIALENARWFLRRNGVVLLALKTASMGRELSGRAHLERTLETLADVGEVEESLSLEPLHRRHFFVEVRPSRKWLAPGEPDAKRPVARPAGRRR